MANDFPNHQPGNWYCLTREQFIVFAGLSPLYKGFLEELQDDVDQPDYRSFNGPERQAFWAAIAAAEAARKFLPRDEQKYCSSYLYMQSNNRSMEWHYITSSGTRFKAVEERQLYRENDEAPQSMDSHFLVQIPNDRDQPGHAHYEALRRGGTYLDF